ncbi:alpha/beta hydrolase [Puteibacter caeruleilacunae]|nr:alpha/beta hydrolase [Puteibacter caeruleilacunae]
MRKLVIFFYCLFTAASLMGQEPESFQTSDNETLYFTRAGDGPAILILGGAGWESKIMTYWVDSLSADYECILLDYRGAGNSGNAKVDSSTINMGRAAQDIEDLRKHLGLEKLTIAGISYGGGLAQNYASIYPKHIKNMVLVSTIGSDYSYDKPFTDNVKGRFYPREKDSIQYWKSYPDKKIAQRRIAMQWLKPYFYDHDLAEKVVPEFFKFKWNGKVSYLMYKDLRTNYDVKEKLKNYKGKCTIVRPRQDPIPCQTSYLIKELIPQAEIVFIEKCGHFPAMERPDVFFKIMKEVLRD